MSEVSDRDSRATAEPALFEPKARLTRSDLWAWRDAVEREAHLTAPSGHGRTGSELDGIVAAMSQPQFYPEAPDGVEVHETFISWVFLAGDRAYKLKKPVVLPFLDYGSADRRREMCEHEVELNQRLAGNVYLGVRAISLREGRLQLAPIGPDAIEYIVEMRRFDTADTLAAMILGGSVTDDMIVAVAQRLASFHACAHPCRVGDDMLVEMERVADGNFEALEASGGVLTRSRVFSAQRFVDAFVAGHAPTLLARAASDRVREGHGDLRAEHVLIGDEVQAVDCVEFDARLRTIDVGADLAFLVMDLARLGRPDLGRVLVDAYRHAGGDPGSDEMVAFHAAVKAWVRAKIALLSTKGPGRPPQQVAAQPEDALELFALGERLAWQTRLPLTLIVCGPPASGKSRLASALSETSGLAVISSDETRKRLHGLDPIQHAPQDAYTAFASEQTYRELGRQAARQLGAAGGVIVDATFARRNYRDAFSAAYAGLPAPLVFECRAPDEVTRSRAFARERDPENISDAGPDTAARIRAHFERLEDDVSARCHFVVRTDQPIECILDDVTAMLDRRLAEPAAPRPLDATPRPL